MPMSDTDRSFLRELYRKLADMALEPNDPFYEPIHQRLGLDDPVQQISTLIDFDGIDSIRLFSGFRGSGKTTELLRLRDVLQKRGYFVLYADALDYVNAAEPIDISDLLMVMAGAFSDALETHADIDIGQESYWTRLWNFLHTQVSVREGTVKLEAATPGGSLLGGIKTGLDLKFELKSATSFRKALQGALVNKLNELKRNVDSFFEFGVKKIKEGRGENTQVVFIFDQLEQLRGTLQTEREVIQSVERIFSTHVDLLRIPYIHAVFTVPPWLKFVLPGTIQITLLSTVHLWNNDKERTRCEPAWNVFHSLISRRFGKDGLERLFGTGPDQRDLVEAVLTVCGGHIRDLLRLLRDTVVRATALQSLPVPRSVVEQAINAARRDFLPIAQEDAKWLTEIERVRATALPNTEAATVNRLARFLDSHFVIYFVNDDEWYDIHPLIRGEVEEVVQATGKPEVAQPTGKPAKGPKGRKAPAVHG